jgi:hypothetical protein
MKYINKQLILGLMLVTYLTGNAWGMNYIQKIGSCITHSMGRITAPVRAAAAWYTARQERQYVERINQINQMRAFALWEQGNARISPSKPFVNVHGQLRQDPDFATDFVKSYRPHETLHAVTCAALEVMGKRPSGFKHCEVLECQHADVDAEFELLNIRAGSPNKGRPCWIPVATLKPLTLPPSCRDTQGKGIFERLLLQQTVNSLKKYNIIRVYAPASCGIHSDVLKAVGFTSRDGGTLVKELNDPEALRSKLLPQKGPHFPS